MEPEITCGNECGFAQPYGFVPEADCPEHDRKDVVDKMNTLHEPKDGEIYYCFNINYPKQGAKR